MLHRLTLRVLPQLSLAVTEPAVRTRKRWVMFVVGFVAFAAYRAAKQVLPLSEPLVLLGVAGVVAALTAGVSYAIGRRVGWSSLAGCESPRRWAWVLGWVGGVYGVQLALLVLALLQIGVNYDFLQHPDGPAMMAIIISCSAVARDAVEIGHVRWLEAQGRSFLTFPDGGSLRALLGREPARLGRWLAIGLLACGIPAWGLGWAGYLGESPLAQLLLATAVGGSVALCAYLDGLSRPQPWWIRWHETRWMELAKFWWWPGFAFAATYFLVAYGLAEFAFRIGPLSVMWFAAVSATVGGLMATYCYYLGARRAFENRIASAVPASMLRCPFITGLLGKQSGQTGSMPAEAMAFSETPHPVRMEHVR